MCMREDLSLSVCLFGGGGGGGGGLLSFAPALSRDRVTRRRSRR